MCIFEYDMLIISFKLLKWSMQCLTIAIPTRKNLRAKYYKKMCRTFVNELVLMFSYLYSFPLAGPVTNFTCDRGRYETCTLFIKLFFILTHTYSRKCVYIAAIPLL